MSLDVAVGIFKHLIYELNVHSSSDKIMSCFWSKTVCVYHCSCATLKREETRGEAVVLLLVPGGSSESTDSSV